MKQTKITTGVWQRHSLLILTLGLVISLLFVTASVIVATMEISRINGQIITLFSGGEQVTYHLGHLGWQLTHFQLLERELIEADNSRREMLKRQILQVDADLTEITRQLPPLLHPDEQSDWHTIYTQFEQIRTEYYKVFTLIEQNRLTEAHRLLDSSSIQSKNIFNSLADLSTKNRIIINSILEETKARHSFVWAIETVTGIGLGAGILSVWLIVIHIIYQQRHRIEQSVAELELINHDLDSFAGRVSHEMKNLLAPVPLIVENIKRARYDPDRIESLSEKLDNFTQLATGIVDGLLVFSKSGQAVYKKEVASLAKELQSSVEELRPMAEQMGAVINLEKLVNARVECPSVLLHVVIRNILHNALKFLNNRAIRTIQINSYIENKMWGVFSIADSGPGIPAEFLSRIFEPFYRVPGTKTTGSGIGLSTVYRIVYSCGGKIDVESELERGTRFIVRLPLAVSS